MYFNHINYTTYCVKCKVLSKKNNILNIVPCNFINFCMNNRQYTFQDISAKRVINMTDGKELGHVCDLVFTSCGRITGFIVPEKKSFIKSFANNDTLFIPWNNIIKVGIDIILVELSSGATVCSAEENNDIN